MPPISAIDQLGHAVRLDKKPERIISLVPSQTELLCDLGLSKELVGLTKFCVHPEGLKAGKTVVGGTKNIHLNRIRTLFPDLIIMNKEENSPEIYDQLIRDYPIWVSDVRSIEDAFKMIEGIALVCGIPERGKVLAGKIREQFRELSDRLSTKKEDEGIPVAYFIWKDPWMVAGGGTFIDQMLRLAGYRNIFSHLDRYPEVDRRLLATHQPALIFLSSEPFPFGRKYMQACRDDLGDYPFVLVDGAMFSWYGSRLRHFPDYALALHEKVNALLA